LGSNDYERGLKDGAGEFLSLLERCLPFFLSLWDRLDLFVFDGASGRAKTGSVQVAFRVFTAFLFDFVWVAVEEGKLGTAVPFRVPAREERLCREILLFLLLGGEEGFVSPTDGKKGCYSCLHREVIFIALFIALFFCWLRREESISIMFGRFVAPRKGMGRERQARCERGPFDIVCLLAAFEGWEM
jgi:hypothetical protein